MNQQEAIQAMREGKKVTHTYFPPEEWVSMEGNKIVLEDGVRCAPSEFWKWRTEASFENGWELWKTREEILRDLKNQYQIVFAGNGYQDEFKADCYMTQCNFGGLLIIVSNSGDSVIVWSDWSDTALSTKLEECSIEYHDSDDCNDNETYIAQFYYQKTWYNLDLFIKI